MKNARETIINVALRLFAEKGYAGCSIREICQAAGITKPVLYYHFQSKKNLYRELMLDIFDHTRKNLLRLTKSRGSVRERLVEFVSSEFSDCKNNVNSVKLVFRVMFSPEEAYPYFNFVEEYIRERTTIADCIRGDKKIAADRRDAELTSTAIMGMMLVQILEHLFTKQSARKLIDLLLPASIVAK